MKSFLDQRRSDWNKPLNNLRKEKNNQLKEKLMENKKSKDRSPL